MFAEQHCSVMITVLSHHCSTDNAVTTRAIFSCVEDMREINPWLNRRLLLKALLKRCLIFFEIRPRTSIQMLPSPRKTTAHKLASVVSVSVNATPLTIDRVCDVIDLSVCMCDLVLDPLVKKAISTKLKIANQKIFVTLSFGTAHKVTARVGRRGYGWVME